MSIADRSSWKKGRGSYLRPELPAQENTPIEESDDHLDAISAMGTRPKRQTHERRRRPDRVGRIGVVLDALEVPGCVYKSMTSGECSELTTAMR